MLSSRVTVRVRIIFSVWLESGYAHLFMLLPGVVIILPGAGTRDTGLPRECHSVLR